MNWKITVVDVSGYEESVILPGGLQTGKELEDMFNGILKHEDSSFSMGDLTGSDETPDGERHWTVWPVRNIMRIRVEQVSG